MKKVTAFILVITVLLSLVGQTALAANEEHQIYDVTMSVANEIINTTTDRIFGFNQEWYNTDVRRNLWLDKNYAKYDSFNNNFELKRYYEPAPEYGEAYLNPGSSKKAKYIANGDMYGGNVSYTRYMVKNDTDLHPNQYEGGVLQHPEKNVEQVSSEHIYNYLNKDNLISGGIDGYVGFNTYWELAKGGVNSYDIEDLTVVADPDNKSNHTVKLSPSKGQQYYGRDSFFGKNSLAIIDRKTTFTYRIRIDSDEADSRLGITKDWDMEHIKDVESKKYGSVGVLQFVKQYNTNQVRGWFDAVKFKNGQVYLAGNSVGNYDKAKWYTVKYTLDIKNGNQPVNTIIVSDDTGKTVINETQDIILDSSANMGRDISSISGVTEDEFEFAERSEYGYLLTAHTDWQNSLENTVVYIDDLDFKTEYYYDKKDNVINDALTAFSQNHVFPYTRMAGTSANSFMWKEGLGDAKTRNRITRQTTSETVIPMREVFALPEWFKMIDFMNSQAQFSYVINVHDSDEDIIDLIEFMTGDGDINGDGEDWARIRRQNGMSDPARIYMWEIANEPDLNYKDPGEWENKWDVDSFLKRAGEIIEILKQYSPDHIKIAVPINTDYMDNIYVAPTQPEKNWDRRYLNLELKSGEEIWQYTDDIDCFAYHSYNPDRCSTVNTAIMHLKESIAASTNPDIEIAYTEHGTNRPGKRSKYVEGIGLASALVEAQFFNRVFTEPVVDSANLHAYSLYPGGWGIGWAEDDGSLRAGATYMLMDMYARNGVGDVLSSDIDGFETVPGETGWEGWNHAEQKWKDGKYGYSCSAVKQADGSISLFISNHRNHTLNLSLDLDSAFDEYEIVEKTVITGKNEEDTITSYDGYSNICIDEENEVYELQYSNDMVYYTDYNTTRDSVVIDPYSVTMLKLENTAVKPVSAIFREQQRLDVKGQIENPQSSREVTLFIEDISTKEIRYIEQATLDSENCYRFNFEFNGGLEGCRALINYCGAVKDITSDFAVVSDEDDLFGISFEKRRDIIVTTINNRYNMLNLPCVMIVAGMDNYNGNTVSGVSLSGEIMLRDGINTLRVGDVADTKYHKIFLWKNLYDIEPLFKARYMK